MVMVNETRSGTPPDVLEEDDDFDGWGPVRLRRSSIPIAMPLSAEAANTNADPLHDDETETRHKSPLKT